MTIYALAFAAANGIGEAFANRGANEIVYASEFMAQTDGYDEFFRRIYVSPNAKNPIVEFWGQGQALADPVAPVARAITGGGAYYRYEWAQEKPNLVIGYDFGVKAVDAADVTGVDLIVAVGTEVAEAVLGDQRVFSVPAGQYRMNFNASHAGGDWIRRLARGLFAWIVRPTLLSATLFQVEQTVRKQPRLAPLPMKTIDWARRLSFPNCSIYPAVRSSLSLVEPFRSASDLPGIPLHSPLRRCLKETTWLLLQYINVSGTSRVAVEP